MTDFHATRMGMRFYESTMPRLVGELARLNGLLGRIAAALEADGRQSNGNTDGLPGVAQVGKRRKRPFGGLLTVCVVGVSGMLPATDRPSPVPRPGSICAASRTNLAHHAGFGG